MHFILKRIFIFLFLSSAFLYAQKTSIQNNERNKTMNLKKINDNKRNSVTLEWEKIKGKDPRLTEIVREVSPILIDTYTKMELDFAKKHPELIPTEYFLKSFAHLTQDGADSIDWKEAETLLTQSLTKIFTETDIAQFSGDDDKYIFITAKDEAGKLIGVIQFLSQPAFKDGHIKIAYFGVAESALNCGLEKELIFTIKDIMPEVTRIFLHTRTTNTPMINLFKEYGFTSIGDNQFKLENWLDLEYTF